MPPIWPKLFQKKSLIPPSGRTAQLGLVSNWTHDHNPLNDARRVAQFYNETMHQISSYLDQQTQLESGHSYKKAKISTVEVVDYSAQWPSAYSKEEKAIKHALGKLCLDIFHVGSTSVPGLVAKPIIDIIAVVQDISKIGGLLTKLGYKYKGEYNLPLRSLYGKKGEYKVYLHVHEKDSAEIDLNLKLRNFLRSNAKAREQYSNLKKSLVMEVNAAGKTNTGITNYNLGKNNFIQKVLKEAGFDGLCMRLCTQTYEWEQYKAIRDDFIQQSKVRVSKKENGIADNQIKYLTLLQGTKVVAAARVDLLDDKYGAIRFISHKSGLGSQEHISYFLEKIERWLSVKKLKFLVSTINQESMSFFTTRGFKITNKGKDGVDILKPLKSD